jgi:hypothetical protein
MITMWRERICARKKTDVAVELSMTGGNQISPHPRADLAAKPKQRVPGA